MIKTPLSTVIGGAFWTPEATVINGAKLSFGIVMEKLFSNGEQGFAYDPNDLSTMFQDAAGTVPVTGVGQAVGLMLDKSKGLSLGGNLANPIPAPTILDANSGTQGTWNPETKILGNTGAIVNTRPRFNFTFPTTAGRFYKITGRLSGNLGVFIQAIPLTKDENGSFYGVIQATSTSIILQIITSLTQTTYLKVEEFIVQEIQGNHAYQTQSAMRPLLVASPQRLDYDIADDKLITNLPAQLTGCTVIRSVPNVGTQILTGQTIPTTYSDNTDHCGLIVVNRALTPSETSAITTEFNKMAGV